MSRGTPQGVARGFQSPADFSSLLDWGRADSVKGRTAAQFTGANSEEFTLASDIVLNATSDWSVGFWVYHDGTTTQGYFAFDGAAQGRVFMVSATDFRVVNDANVGVLTGINLGIGTGAWDYMVLVNTGSTAVLTVYVNGTLKATSAAWSGAITLSRIGSVNDASYFFDGRMQEWAVWSAYALTSGDRSTLYNSGNGITYESWSGTAPTAWWKMHENSGTRADSAGSNTLTDVNTVTANDGKVAYAVTADASVVARWIGSKAVATLDQATHTKKPLLKTNIVNSQPVVRFDGTDDFLKAASGALGTQPFWGWAVVDDNDAGTRYYFDGGAASKVAVFHDGTNLNVNAGSSVGAAHTAGAPHLVTFVVNGASSIIYVDGTQLATGDAGAQNQDGGLTVGATQAGASPLAGDVAEWGFVSGSPSAQDLANLKSYINTRYNLGVA